ncbi:hypothetical protein R5R35_011553 [Gryllus longicercus]|uniref:LysM domain-containing protein n=1 Tax=Gryllus longicercus TaxID=2509291 RepID=A0AAN9Z811_9ORTH
MNRASKWYQTTRENRRPRRQCYQPLNADEHFEHEANELGCGVADTLTLAPIQPELYVEKLLEPGDTLQTLSLQFNCPVAELKRINHILRDNEIYARRKIKVPVKPGSVLTEKLAGVHSNGLKNEGSKECAKIASSTDEENEDIAIKKLKSVEPTQLSFQYFDLNKYSKCETILNNPSDPSTSFSLASNENTLLLETDNSGTSLETNAPHEINSNNENIPFKCNGADWGLSWLQIVICALLLGFGGPLFIYIFYIVEKNRSN